MQFGETLHVGFVNDGVVPGNLAMQGLALPIEAGVDHDAFGHEGRAVALVEGSVVARFHFVAVDRRIPFQFAEVRAGVGIEQQFVGIKTMASVRRIGAVHAVTINRVRADIGEIAVPNLIGIFGEFDAIELLSSGLIKDADLDFGGVRGKDREVGALAVPGSAARVGQPFLNLGFQRRRHLAGPFFSSAE